MYTCACVVVLILHVYTSPGTSLIQCHRYLHACGINITCIHKSWCVGAIQWQVCRYFIVSTSLHSEAFLLISVTLVTSPGEYFLGMVYYFCLYGLVGSRMYSVFSKGSLTISCHFHFCGLVVPSCDVEAVIVIC